VSNLIPFNEIENMAIAVSKSKLFGISTPEQAMSLMILCQAEGLHPGIAMRDYHLIQGRPALKADAMLARFQQAGGKVEWKEYTDEKVTGVFSHPQGGTLELSWTLAKAKSIGIANKDNWKNYPRAMLRARVVSEGIRSVYPGCVVGVYTPEEVQDFTPSPAKDMGVAERVDTPVIEIPDGAFKLYVPGNDDPYSAFHSKEEWVQGYVDMVARISLSSKLQEDVKREKLDSLKAVNMDMLESLDSTQKIKIRALLVEAGVSTNPKPEPSPTSPTSEPSEPEF